MERTCDKELLKLLLGVLNYSPDQEHLCPPGSTPSSPGRNGNDETIDFLSLSLKESICLTHLCEIHVHYAVNSMHLTAPVTSTAGGYVWNGILLLLEKDNS